MSAQPDPSAAAPDPEAGDRPGVSVVVPVLDEERHLSDAVGCILEQEYDGPLEVVLALGPSKDRTDEVAARIAAADPRVRLVRNPSGRTPAGLNAAVAASSHPVVVRVDGHGLLAPGYVATAVRTLAETGADNVGGVMAAEGVTPFEQAVARAMTSWFGVGGARFHTGGEAGPADTVYLGVFRREVLRRLGGFDESFVRAQDWELNFRIRAAGGLVWFTPDLHVTYRPRGSVRALARQYRDYGRWRRVVMRRHSGTVSARYLAAPAAVVGSLVGLIGAVLTPWALVLPGGYLLALLAGTALTARGLPPRATAVLPLVYATMHLSWGTGFLTSPRGLGRTPRAQVPGATTGPAAGLGR